MTEGLPQGWISSTLRDLSIKITDGTHQPPPFVEAGVPFVVIGNIQQGLICWDGIKKWVSKETFQNESRRIRPQPGDLLYSAVGSYGLVVLVEDDRPFMFQRHIAYIRPDTKLIDPRYLFHALTAPRTRAQADAVARGVAQRTVTLGDLGRFDVPVPPISEQRRIVTKLDSLSARLRAARDELAGIPKLVERLKHAVLAAALSFGVQF